MEPRLVLGFDAGCGSCSGLAESVRQAAGGRLEVASLSSPEMTSWRHQKFGREAPWVPTLVVVKGSAQARVFTGVRLGVMLSRYLPPSQVWAVSVALGAHRRQTPQSPMLNRSQFVRGVGGAIAVVGLLAARTPTTEQSPNENGDDREWLAGLDLVSSEELSQAEGRALMASAVELDLPSVLAHGAQHSHIGALDLEGGAWTSLSAEKNAILLAVRHRTARGEELVALTYQREGDAVAFYRLSSSQGPERTSTKVLRIDEIPIGGDLGEVQVRLVAGEEDGVVYVPTAKACTRSSQCGSTYCYTCKCSAWSLNCIFNCCAPCTLACMPPKWACLACAIAYCPVCLAINQCCSSSHCAYRPGKYC